MKKSIFALAAAAALSLSGYAPCKAQTSDPEVKTLISQVAESYRNLKAFSATIELTQGSGPTAMKVTTKLVLEKPNKISATVTRATETKHFVSDGANYFVDSSKDTKKYIKGPTKDFSSSVEALASNGGAGVGLLPILLSSPKAESQMIPGKPSSVKKIADMTVSTDSCDTIQAILGEGERQSAYTFAFAKTDHLLRKLTIGLNKPGADPQITETYTDVNTTPPISADTFTYVPAPGATATDPPKAPAYFDPRLVPGATPFPLKGTDLNGKPVSYSAYKGKVLLVDFWATWCGPCVAELPNVIAAYGKYHSKGFDVLGISLDQPNSRPKLEAFTKEHNMPWPQVYDGKYWEAANAEAYGVRAIPFTLLIGKDGKIAAVGARGEALAPAIEAALKK